MDAKPVPVGDPLTRAFWQGCAQRRLLIQRCAACGHRQFYPRLCCTQCGARDLEWVPAAGRGTIRSFTVIRRAVSAAFEADVPYVVALVALEEGPVMMANVVGCDPSALAIGDAVVVTFERRGEAWLPQFEIAAA